jgi:hypothetical protein
MSRLSGYRPHSFCLLMSVDFLDNMHDHAIKKVLRKHKESVKNRNQHIPAVVLQEDLAN